MRKTNNITEAKKRRYESRNEFEEDNIQDFFLLFISILFILDLETKRRGTLKKKAGPKNPKIINSANFF